MLHQTRSMASFVVMTAACALAVAAVVGPLGAQMPKAIGEITGTVIDARSQKPLAVLGLLGSLFALASPAKAQQCPSSDLTYIIRDANGRLFEEAFKSVGFTGSNRWMWRGLWESYSFQGFATVMPPELQEVAKLLVPPHKASTLWTGSGGCSFETAPTLNLTMAGKTMQLVFNTSLKCCKVESFLVDGLPFQEGRFQITLTTSKQGHHSFLPATSWTKISK